MTVSASFVDYVLGQLGRLGSVTSRRMFGGVGLYREGRFFGLIDDDTLYLKVDDRNRENYLSRRMAPFRPYKDRPGVSMSYYEAPADIVEDPELLVSWALEALRAAAESPAPSAGRKRANAGRKSANAKKQR